ncbi:hypothetical protein SAMN04489859_10164 [Paracoccus alcaliphilus]|uniref:Uncharacterized protein n=1 Tax=Paracoccus alcaliphilus TaxID=34002 RepID=A0A1H8J7A0_9RHOB|nr:hypothetical protein SAMN04489859_10164 [Paracoccus alcaliphilus]
MIRGLESGLSVATWRARRCQAKSLKHILRKVEPDRGIYDMTVLLCGYSQTLLGPSTTLG